MLFIRHTNTGARMVRERARVLTVDATILQTSAQWLSNNMLAVTCALAGLGFAAEGFARLRSAQVESCAGQRSHWSRSWRVNVALLAITIAVSWSLSPWLTPVFTEALNGRTGLTSFIELPLTARVVIGFLLLDLSAYFLHYVSHHVGWLWRLHQVHHSDMAMNASTHFRQHPITLVVTLATQLPLLWLLGIPALSWVIYGAISTAVQLWHHSSVAAPAWAERAIGWALVTPGLHRKHHHTDRAVHDHNYGSVLSFWDHLFGTHTEAAPGNPHGAPPTGLAYVRTRDAFSVTACLQAPFRATDPARGGAPAGHSLQKHPTRSNSKLTTSQHRKTS